MSSSLISIGSAILVLAMEILFLANGINVLHTARFVYILIQILFESRYKKWL